MGRHIQQHPYSMVFAYALKRAGLPGWANAYDLRHFYASILIRSGASIKAIQVRLGHSSAKTTLDIYGYLFPDEADRTRLTIEEAFAEGPNEVIGSAGKRVAVVWAIRSPRPSASRSANGGKVTRKHSLKPAVEEP